MEAGVYLRLSNTPTAPLTAFPLFLASYRISRPVESRVHDHRLSWAPYRITDDHGLAFVETADPGIGGQRSASRFSFQHRRSFATTTMTIVPSAHRVIAIIDQTFQPSSNTMKQRSLLAIMAVFVLALVSTTSTAFSQGNGRETTKEAFENPSYYNPCCDEMVSLSGVVHTSVKTTTNADGTTTYTVHQSVSGVKGTGLSSGISYNASENVKQTDIVMPNPPYYPYSSQGSLTLNFVGKGKGGRQCSFKIRLTFQFVVDANGNITTNNYNVEFICANGNEISQAVAD
jgi:hypothetical protein